MKMGRGVCAHLRSFFLFLYQSMYCRYKRLDTPRHRVYNRTRSRLCLPLSLLLPLPSMSLISLLKNHSKERTIFHQNISVTVVQLINARTIICNMPPVVCNEQKVYNGGKDGIGCFVFGHRSR